MIYLFWVLYEFVNLVKVNFFWVLDQIIDVIVVDFIINIVRDTIVVMVMVCSVDVAFFV